ncbi:phage protein GemA/Gp16 family protein [Palleronia sp.]|uniref:phage protein GemA/Gp16 family protein n=1 Tax=Palleronia sp. TaxID=1940284 RepID=UPI0035C84240
MIRGFWDEGTRGAGTPDGLNTWIERTFHVSSLRSLTKSQGQRAITALKAMKARAA